MEETQSVEASKKMETAREKRRIREDVLRYITHRNTPEEKVREANILFNFVWSGKLEQELPLETKTQ